jgi:hypothetical protein
MKRNRYRREINDRKYYVHIAEFWTHTTVAVRNGWSRERDTTYIKKRKWFCEDTERFAANLLADAVNIREDNIEKRQQYDERVERALDVVQEEYEDESI